MIDGVSDYLLWPIRTLAQAQADLERWRRPDSSDKATVAQLPEGIKPVEYLGATPDLAQDVMPASEATPPDGGIKGGATPRRTHSAS